jgi:uncharacterized protein
MVQSIMYLFTGALAGALSGLLGIGGGIIMVPILILLFGLTQYQAQGTSIAVMVPPIGLLAALVYYKKGYVNLPMAVLMSAGFLVGAFFGAKLAVNLPEQLLKRLFGFALFVTSIKMMFFK